METNKNNRNRMMEIIATSNDKWKVCFVTNNLRCYAIIGTAKDLKRLLKQANNTPKVVGRRSLVVKGPIAIGSKAK